MKRIATIRVEEYYGHGMFRAYGGQDYVFDYGSQADIGYGTISLNRVGSNHEYTVVNVSHQENDDPWKITVEIEGHLLVN